MALPEIDIQIERTLWHAGSTSAKEVGKALAEMTDAAHSTLAPVVSRGDETRTATNTVALESVNPEASPGQIAMAVLVNGASGFGTLSPVKKAFAEDEQLFHGEILSVPFTGSKDALNIMFYMLITPATNRFNSTFFVSTPWGTNTLNPDNQ